MKSVGPLSRIIALAGLLLVAPLSAAPAMAARADVELLQSYVGDWRGKGEMVGAETETVVCRLSLTKGNQDKVNYSGRCSLAGTVLSVNGTLAYNDSARRFEAAMSSNATFSGLAVGKRQGSALVFNLKERNKDEAGNDLTISAAITLRKEKINVDFKVVFNATGDSMTASVPFSK
jgi:hypothetical protein